MQITATYSPEDNKLRLYASSRLDAETYAKVKAAGFKWAPRQELFVAPAWSVAREDLCIELAGEIEAEESTMAERAEAKAERLEALADKNRGRANAFADAAHRISERFAMGQPILVGHHSERRARKDRERADSAMRQAVKAEKAVGYWLYKASSAQHHANRKNRDDVRARRIKTLLAELRDLQRKLNHASVCIKLLEENSEEKLRDAVGQRLKTGELFYWEAWDDLQRNGKTMEEIKAKALAIHNSTLNNEKLHRWIDHTLNRLGYERELLGEVPRFEGEITPVMLQEFTREHGADIPKGSKLPDGRLCVKSLAPLPAHIGDGNELALTADEWRDLMQSCGYEAVAKAEAKKKTKAATLPLLNIDAETITERSRYGNAPRVMRVIKMTKAEYAKVREYSKYISISPDGFRFRACKDPAHKGDYFSGPTVAVFLTDSKAHTAPAPVAPIAEAAE